MNVLDQLAKENLASEEYQKKLSSASKQFNKQKSALLGIKDTPGFKEIKRYRESTAEAANVKLKSATKETFEESQTTANVAEKFLSYLQ